MTNRHFLQVHKTDDGYTVSSDLRSWFDDDVSNTTITDLLVLEGVVRKEQTDPEYSCSYFYFQSLEEAEDFRKAALKSETLRLKVATELAESAHDGQRYKDAGVDRPYTYHLYGVAKPLEGDARVVAVLHDILEDTDVALDALQQLFPPHIVDAVVAITRNKKETYKDYIQRCSRNELARKVKVVDLRFNLTHGPSLSLAARYHRALGSILSA